MSNFDDPLENADQKLAIIHHEVRLLREMLHSGEDGSFAMHDAVNIIEQAADDLIVYINLARSRTDYSVEVARSMLEQRRLAMAAYRDALALLRKMGLD